MKNLIIATLFILVFSSCKKFVDPGSPRTQLDGESVFQTDATATGAALALYSQMEGLGIGYYISLYTGYSADELKTYSTQANLIEIATNNITPENSPIYSVWSNNYKFIYQANLILQKLENSDFISGEVQKQLRGEALFVRAFCYFYLMQLYGPVPLIRGTNYQENAIASRNSIDEIAAAVTLDLNEAIGLLDENYRAANNSIGSERIRPNRSVAKGLLSRLQLYQSKWTEAEANATAIMGNTIYQLENNVNNVFLKGSKEALWQWQAVFPRYNSYSGGMFVLTATPNNSALQPSMLNIYSNSDARRTNWIKSLTIGSNTYYFSNKYKVGINAASITEYTMVMRLAEIILIRSEARCQLNNLTGAQSDINLIRNRAGLSSFSGLTKTALLDSIRVERQREMMVEFGDRWIDMKRTGQVNTVMSAYKGSNWQSTDQLYPISQTEILRNPKLEQNPGY